VRVPALHDGFELFLARGQLVEVGIGLGIGGEHLVEFSHGVQRLTHAVFHVAAHVLARVQLRFLLKVADLDAGLGAGLALDVLVDAGHDAQQGGLAGAVQAQHADLGAGVERQGDVFQDFALGRHDLGDTVHRVDILRHGSVSLLSNQPQKRSRCVVRACPAPAFANAAARRSVAAATFGRVHIIKDR